MPFLGWTLTTLVLPPMADKVGRKWITRCCILLLSCCLAAMLLSKSLAFTITLMFIGGACSAGRASVGFVYGNEFLVGKWRDIFSTLFVFVDGFSVVMSGLYFDFMSKQYMWLSLWAPILGFASCIGLFWLPESPLWQLKVGRVREAQLTLYLIMKVNGIEDAGADIDELEQIAERESVKNNINTSEIELN